LSHAQNVKEKAGMVDYHYIAQKMLQGRRKKAYERKKQRDNLEQPLTVKQSLFVSTLLETGDYGKAATASGYRGIRNYYSLPPRLKKEIDKLTNKAMEKSMTDLEWKIKKLKRIADVAMPDSFNNLDDFEKKLINPNASISAVAELNKMQGDYAPVKTETTNVLVDAQNEEIDSLIEEAKKEF
jgi:hypothetical protein